MKVSKELKIGIFVTVVLILSFVIINFLREKDIFNSDISVSATYPDVCGLTASAPVYIKGYKAGTVSDITYSAETETFIVTCSFQKEFVLHADSKMCIYSVDIMGGKGIELVPGASAEPLEDGDMVEGVVRSDLLASLGNGLIPLVEKISMAIDSLNVTVSAVNSVLSEENRAGISSSIMRLDAILADAERVSSAVGGRSAELEEFITNLTAVSGRLSAAVESADSAFAGIGRVAAELERSDIEALVVSFRALLDSIQDPDGSLGKLMSDGKAYDSLETLLSDISSLIRKIEENPKKYIRISLF